MPTSRRALSAEQRSEEGSRFGLRSLVGLALVLLVALPFLGLLVAVERRSASLEFLDLRVADLLNEEANANPLLLDVSQAVTHLGGTPVAVYGFTLAVVLLWIRRLHRLALYVAVTGIGVALLTTVSKDLVGRARPLVDTPVAVLPSSGSFPSGHSLTSMVMGGLLLLLVLRLPRLQPPLRATLIVLAALFPLAVGLTRLVLGVHYVSDVVAGWSLGAVWLAVTTTALRRWERRVPVEHTQPVAAASDTPATRLRQHGGPLPRAAAVRLLAAWSGLVAVAAGAGWLVTGPLAAAASRHLDAVVAQALVRARSEALTDLARAASLLADTVVVVAVAVAAALVAGAVASSWWPVLFVATCVGGESLAYLAVSRVVGRARPDVPDLTSGLPAGASWPSGHVAAAVALYGAIAVLLRPGVSATRLVPAVATAALVVIGTARVYLGAHYLTDVVAGAVVGALWLAVCMFVLRRRPARGPSSG